MPSTQTESWNAVALIVALLAIVWLVVGLVRNRIERPTFGYSLAFFASFLLFFEANYLPKPTSSASLSHVKGLTVAVLVYAADHDDRIGFISAGNETLTRSPFVKGIGYGLNAYAVGATLSEVADRNMLLIAESNGRLSEPVLKSEADMGFSRGKIRCSWGEGAARAISPSGTQSPKVMWRAEREIAWSKIPVVVAQPAPLRLNPIKEALRIPWIVLVMSTLAVVLPAHLFAGLRKSVRIRLASYWAGWGLIGGATALLGFVLIP